jgi:hypothetical protein
MRQNAEHPAAGVRCTDERGRTRTMRPIIASALLLTVSFGFAYAQIPLTPDTSIVFQPSSPIIQRSIVFTPFSEAWGGDILVSNNGFGLGVFYRHEFSETLSGIVHFLISDVKDDAEVERYSYYGESLILGKKNRLLMMPLTFGLQYRLFKDDIADNFRPFISAGLGPTMIFVAPYARMDSVYLSGGGTVVQQEQVEFFSSLKYGQMRYTIGGYIGAGAYFGIDRSSVSGLNIRYYYVPFPKGIEVMDGGRATRFGGLYISLLFGTYF